MTDLHVIPSLNRLCCVRMRCIQKGCLCFTSQWVKASCSPAVHWHVFVVTKTTIHELVIWPWGSGGDKYFCWASFQKWMAACSLPHQLLRMKFEDFKVHFDKVEICNLTPDALEDSTAHKWEVTIHQGSWVRGATAGGCRNFLGKYIPAWKWEAGTEILPALSYSSSERSSVARAVDAGQFSWQEPAKGTNEETQTTVWFKSAVFKR